MTVPTPEPSEVLRHREVVLEVSIDARLEHVWECFVRRTADWWPAEFCAGGADAKAFHIDPRVDGLVWEDWGDGEGLVWGRVTSVKRPTLLQTVGDTSRQWGGPNRSFMTWNFEEPEDRPGTTLLRFEQSVWGVVSDTTEASLLEGWKLLLEEQLKTFAETGKAPRLGTA